MLTNISMAKKKYCKKKKILQEYKHVKTFYGKKKKTRVSCRLLLKTVVHMLKRIIIYSTESCATAVPDVSDLD